MSKALADAFYTRLTLSQGAGTYYAALSGQIYKGQAPENKVLPLAVFNLVSNPADPMFDGKVTSRIEVELETFVPIDEGVDSAQTTDDKAFTALDQGTVSSVTGFDRASIQCIERGVPVVLEDAISVRSRYLVVGTTT